MKTIGVLTSGGDSPGMNAAVRSVVRHCHKLGLDVYGIEHGYQGLLDDEVTQFFPKNVAGIISRGGTILRSARCAEFRTKEGRAKAAKCLADRKIEGLVVIGGDGSMTGAKLLFEEHGIRVVGIPGTIDNDIYGTDISLGADTALNTIKENVDKLTDTADSHGRAFVVEVMGRSSGYLAVISAMVTGAEAALVPEFPFDIKQINDNINARIASNKHRHIIIVAEGAGSAQDIAKQLVEMNPKLDCRYTVLGHIVRGGSPSVYDRLLGTRMGIACVDSLIRGENAVMAGTINGEIVMVPFETVFSQKKLISRKVYEDFLAL